jgi:hypothetical protein
LESGSQLRVPRRLDHLGQRLEDLLLSAVERFEFVNVKVFEGLKFHLDRLEIGVGVRGAFAP